MATIAEVTATPRLAWLILAHDHPQQLGRLLKRLAGGTCYVHVDARTSPIVFSAMQAAVPEGVRAIFVARRPCRWGGFSLVDATLDLIRAALADGFDWATLLSGADYPLKSTAQISAFLAAQTTRGFIDIRDQARFDVAHRWQAFHPEALHGRVLGKVLQKAQRGLHQLGWRRALPTPLSAIYAGSQWWTLSAEACAAVLAFIAQSPHLLDFFRSTSVPDEMFFQTLLMHTPLAAQLQPDNQRLIQWDEGAWSPHTWGAQDLPKLSGSNALFARKFAADGEVSNLLDATLAGQPS